MHYVYLLKSLKINWVYVGSTNNVEKRLNVHNNGGVRSTKSKRPLVLIYTETYDSATEARKRERKIKTSRIVKNTLLKKIGPIV